MLSLFAPVTQLLSELPVLKLKVFISNDDNGEKGMYVKNYQVDIKEHPEVSSDKYVNLESILVRKIELRVFTDKGFSGVSLTPLDIRKHARLVFMQHRDYETTGNVLVKGIPKAVLLKHYIGRRGFGKFFHRDAYYDGLAEKMRFIVGSSDEVPSSPSMGSRVQIEEQTLGHEVSSSNSMAFGRFSEEKTSPE